MKSGFLIAALVASGVVSGSSVRAANPIVLAQAGPPPINPFQIPSTVAPNQPATPGGAFSILSGPFMTPINEPPRSNPQLPAKEPPPAPPSQIKPKVEEPFEIPKRKPEPETKIRRYEPSVTTGGVRGTIVLGKVCSVVMPAKDCVTRPYQGALRVRSIDRSVAFRLQTDAQGRFQWQGMPGVYILEPMTGTFPALTKATVRLIPGMTRTEDIRFDGKQ